MAAITHVDPAVVRGERVAEHWTTQVSRSEADSRPASCVPSDTARRFGEHRVLTLRCIPRDTPGCSWFVRSERGNSVRCPKNNAPVRSETAGSSDTACHSGRVSCVIEISDVLRCEYPSRQGLVNDVCGQQDGRGDLIADLLIKSIGILDFKVVEMVVVLNEVMPESCKIVNRCLACGTSLAIVI